MNIMQTITDYIMKSILTAHGDLVVRGIALPEALAAVAAGQVLKSAGVGAKPIWEKPSISDLKWDIRYHTISEAGDIVVSDMTFEPKLFILFAIDSTAANLNSSVGFDDGTTALCLTMNNDGTQQSINMSNSYAIKRDATNHIRGKISAMASDGYTITSTEDLTALAQVLVLAIG